MYGHHTRNVTDAPDDLVDEQRVVDTPMTNPRDVTFGVPDLDRLFVTSIAVNLGENAAPTAEAGWVLAVEGLGVTGRPESRFRLG